MKRLLALSFGDLKNISRDSMLLIALLVPFILAFLMRPILPFVREVLHRELSFELSEYYGLIMSFLILVTPMMIGMLSGFLILDERDEKILFFYSVTPLSKSGYLLYRVTAPAIVTFVLSFFVFYGTDKGLWNTAAFSCCRIFHQVEMAVCSRYNSGLLDFKSTDCRCRGRRRILGVYCCGCCCPFINHRNAYKSI